MSQETIKVNQDNVKKLIELCIEENISSQDILQFVILTFRQMQETNADLKVEDVLNLLKSLWNHAKDNPEAISN